MLTHLEAFRHLRNHFEGFGKITFFFFSAVSSTCVFADYTSYFFPFTLSFCTSSLNDYFSCMKDRQWLFYKKSEQYQVWKLVPPGLVVLNRLRKVQEGRLPERNNIE